MNMTSLQEFEITVIPERDYPHPELHVRMIAYPVDNVGATYTQGWQCGRTDTASTWNNNAFLLPRTPIESPSDSRQKVPFRSKLSAFPSNWSWQGL